MLINRSNYEEFFLLYVDNELSATERHAVELFVGHNPDLGKELQLFQQSIVLCDEIIFDDKKSLLKDGSVGLQERLLLFVDDELTPEETEQVTVLLATDRAVAAEWKILRQTKLNPVESIVFKNKASLYRTEAEPVIGIKWWRVAAAAVLLGFGIWLGKSVFKSDEQNGSSETKSIATSKKNQSQQNTSKTTSEHVQTTAKEYPNDETVNVTEPQYIRDQHLSEKNTLVKTNNNDSTVKSKQIKQTGIKPWDHNNVVKEDLTVKKPGINLTNTNLEKLNKPGSNKEDLMTVQPKTMDNINYILSPVENKTDLAVARKDKQIEAVKKINDSNEGLKTNIIAKNVMYDEDDNKADNRILYMDEDKVKRKLGSFLRKIKRAVERNTNIKAGTSVKVAGFEIAIK